MKYRKLESNTSSLIPIQKKSPTFFAPRTSFMEDNFSMDRGRGTGAGIVLGWLKCITFLVHFISIIINLLHLRSSGIRSQRLGTPAIGDIFLPF